MTKNIAQSGLMVAFAFICSYIEMLFPIQIGIPGVKLGLANLVVLLGLYFLPCTQVFVILIARLVLSSFLFGNMASFLYSLSGAILSFISMKRVARKHIFSIIGVSILGGVFHNIGQLLMAMILLHNIGVLTYLPILLISGMIAGTLVGLLGRHLLPIAKKMINS